MTPGIPDLSTLLANFWIVSSILFGLVWLLIIAAAVVAIVLPTLLVAMALTKAVNVRERRVAADRRTEAKEHKAEPTARTHDS